MEKQQYTPGAKCSKNYVLKKRITTIAELYEILETQKSIFWRHRVQPTAVLMQQKICVLASTVKAGQLWEIEKEPNDDHKFYNELSNLLLKYGYDNPELHITDFIVNTGENTVSEVIKLTAKKTRAKTNFEEIIY